MTQDEIAGVAKAVTEQLMNGPLREMIREEIGEALGDTPRKVDDIHGWFQDLNRRVSELETAND